MKWADPPETPVSRDIAYEDEANELRDHPKQWGLLRSWPVNGKNKSAPYSAANQINQGKFVAFRPKGAFEAVSRREKDEHGREVVNVYARYLGDG